MHTIQPSLYFFLQNDDLHLPGGADILSGEDLDSGVSDVGQMSDCETDGSRSPDTRNRVVDFGDMETLSPTSSFGIGEDEIAETADFPPLFPEDFDFEQVPSFKVAEPSFDGFDWREVESMALEEVTAAQ